MFFNLSEGRLILSEDILDCKISSLFAFETNAIIYMEKYLSVYVETVLKSQSFCFNFETFLYLQVYIQNLQ